ncbi:hypothetical protein [Streptomyces sp. NBC_00572]|uniref:hypothetical protein n=1 Tax=Streptomyces sp. NBC_00572 TaxID=2903664 RepID=UPI002258F0ED|nr:hypothetical protein [Streptomyces sp. NBC_00572]MCX4986359.1 hypothetical protein [Streptomyces sp. NBC_00572]
MALYRWPRFNRDTGVADRSAQEERRARQYLRNGIGALLRTLNTPEGVLDAEAADAVDIAPARHRHSSLWLA